jgi:hypothetical protein
MSVVVAVMFGGAHGLSHLVRHVVVLVPCMFLKPRPHI